MENLRQEFLNQAVSNLENIQLKLSNELPNENFLREIFRTLHTIKGTSKTFNFNVSGKFAHELENLLHAAQDCKIPIDENFVSLLREGLKILSDYFYSVRKGDSAASISPEFTEKLHNFLPHYSEKSFDEDSQDGVPPDIWRQLNLEERKTLSAQIADGSKFYEIEAGFDFANFTEEFPHLRESLSTQGEVIAVFPQPAVSEKDRIGFRFFFASKKSKAEIAEAIKSFDKNLKLFDLESNFVADLQGVAAQAISAGEKIARQFGKEVKFETAVDNCTVSGEYLNLISQILLHLINNAVDHAIEKKGLIKIQLLSADDNLILRVSDNGSGFNFDKIRAEAIEKNLIAPDKILSIEDIFKLIFTHGFTTSKKVSEVSGRGVGLDAVGDSVEKLNGKINIESNENGAVFEIILPKEK